MKKMSKKDYAPSVIQQALRLSSRKPGSTYVFPDYQCRIVNLGSGSVAHTIPNTDEDDEMIDVFQGRKVFSARRERGADWEVVTFKRGEWVTWLVIATAAYSM